MYLVQVLFNWQTEWETVHGKRWAKHGHSTPWGAAVHKWFHNSHLIDSGYADTYEIRTVRTR